MIRDNSRIPLDLSAKSDKGKTRNKNEDYFGVFEPETDELMESRGVLAIVCDGMGGHFSGGDASRLVVEVMGEAYFKDMERPATEVLKDAFIKANGRVFEEIGDGRKGLAGTTCTCVVLFPDHFHIAHAGDSRAYLVRDGKIRQLTDDHSVVGEMFRKGILDREEVRTHPRRNVITRAVGLSENVTPDIYESIEYRENDSIVICSDGLFSELKEEEISDIVSTLTPQEACDRLVDRANEEGGSDNITVIVARKIASV